MCIKISNRFLERIKRVVLVKNKTALLIIGLFFDRGDSFEIIF